MIQIEHVSREYGPVKALDDVTLDIKAGNSSPCSDRRDAGKLTPKAHRRLRPPDLRRVCFDGGMSSDLQVTPAGQYGLPEPGAVPHMSVGRMSATGFA